MATIIAPHTSNALYAAFVEQLSKDLCEGLTAVQTRKVSSALSVLGNTKQQEERDKASGKKKVSLTCGKGADDRLLANPSWQLDPRSLARLMTWRHMTMSWRMTISCSPLPVRRVVIDAVLCGYVNNDTSNILQSSTNPGQSLFMFSQPSCP
jgi:hypothetical protein